MECNVKLYKNTGFDLANIAESPVLLNNFASLDVNFVYVKQNGGLTNIKIEAKYEDVLDVDYCVIGDIYYFVTDVFMINDNTCSLSIMEDVILTLGGIQNLEILDGWCTRKHVNSDELFENTIPEDFQPQQIFETKMYPMQNYGDYTEDIVAVVSTVNLDSDELYKANVYVGEASEGDYRVVVPRINDIPTNPTEITMTMPDGEELTQEYPSVYLFYYTYTQIKRNIEKLRSLGLEGAILGCYRIPASFVGEIAPVNGSPGQIGTLKSEKLHNIGIGDDESGVLDYKYTYTDEDGNNFVPQNNKVYSQFNSVTLFSVCTGDQQSYEMREIYNNLPIPTVDIISNLSPDGCPILRPSTINGQETTKYNMGIGCVKGANWLNSPLRFDEVSGSALNAANTAITKSQASSDWDKAVYQFSNPGRYFKQFSQMTSGVNAQSAYGNASAMTSASGFDVVGALGNMMGMAGNVMLFEPGSARRDLETLARSQMSDILQYEIKQNLVVPTIAFGQNVDLQMFIGNKFGAITLRLSLEDLKRFDKYLTLYGYKVSEPLTKDAFFGRVNFNFVSGTGISVLCNSKYSNRDRRIRAAKALEGGVRIWHTAPSTAKLYNNPIKEVTN